MNIEILHKKFLKRKLKSTNINEVIILFTCLKIMLYICLIFLINISLRNVQLIYIKLYHIYNVEFIF